MRPEDRIRLLHIFEAGEALAGFVAGRGRGDLDTDQMLAFALARAIEIIGEAASKVSEETRALAPTMPWPDIVGVRNRLVHAYFNVDHDILWKAATEEVPQLLLDLRPLLEETHGDN